MNWSLALLGLRRCWLQFVLTKEVIPLLGIFYHFKILNSHLHGWKIVKNGRFGEKKNYICFFVETFVGDLLKDSSQNAFDCDA